MSKITLADCEPYTDAQLIGTDMAAKCSWEWKEATIPLDPDVVARNPHGNLRHVRKLCHPRDHLDSNHRYTTAVALDEWLYPATPEELAYWRWRAHQDRTLHPIRVSLGMRKDEAYLRSVANGFVEASRIIT